MRYFLPITFRNIPFVLLISQFCIDSLFHYQCFFRTYYKDYKIQLSIKKKIIRAKIRFKFVIMYGYYARLGRMERETLMRKCEKMSCFVWRCSLSALITLDVKPRFALFILFVAGCNIAVILHAQIVRVNRSAAFQGRKKRFEKKSGKEMLVGRCFVELPAINLNIGNVPVLCCVCPWS